MISLEHRIRETIDSYNILECVFSKLNTAYHKSIDLSEKAAPYRSTLTSTVKTIGIPVRCCYYLAVELPSHILSFAISPKIIKPILTVFLIRQVPILSTIFEPIALSIVEFSLRTCLGVFKQATIDNVWITTGLFLKASWTVLQNFSLKDFAVASAITAVFMSTLFGVRACKGVLEYYATTIEEALRAPFTNIRVKKSIPLITPALSLFTKLFHAVYPPEPTPNYHFSKKITEQVDAIIAAMQNQKRNRSKLENVILYGPPGTGKTLLAQTIAEGADMNFIRLSGADLLTYVSSGKHLSKLNELLNRVKRGWKPTVIFIDEAEQLAGKRGSMTSAQRELITVFLEQTGEPEIAKKMMFIMTTNRPQDLDSAIYSRATHHIYIGTPELKERAKILKEHIEIGFAKSPELDGCLDDRAIDTIATKTDHLSGRALQQLVNHLQIAKGRTDNNQLTWDIVDKAVYNFVWTQRLSPDFQRSWRIVEIVSDLWHFHLPWLTRRVFELPSRAYSAF